MHFRLKASIIVIASVLALALGVTPVMAQMAAECDHTNMIEASIDIRPFVSQNLIIANGRGVVPVALFGSATFNVRSVDHASVGLHAMGRCDEAAAPVTHTIADINRDGFKDAVYVFKTQDLTLTPADVEACLHGMLDGNHFCGHDSVVVKSLR